jgi:predicted ABC-type ATPase
VPPRLGVAEVRPVAWLVVGINGAGKTTFYEEFLRPRLDAEFVNADAIARARWGDAAVDHAYEAGKLAEIRRRELIAEKRSFIAETVFSHPSKLDLVRDLIAAGYRVHLFYVHVPLKLAERRVATRVALGGHDVPAQKLRSRYPRVISGLLRAIPLVERAYLYDNSRGDRLHRHVMTFADGRLVRLVADPPRWVGQLFPRLRSTARRRH